MTTPPQPPQSPRPVTIDELSRLKNQPASPQRRSMLKWLSVAGAAAATAGAWRLMSAPGGPSGPPDAIGNAIPAEKATAQALTPEGTIQLALAEHPRLLQPMQPISITVAATPPTRLLVWRDAQGSIQASSQLCTHAGCSVQLHERGFYCGCHHGAFDPTGAVIQGPPPTPLPQYPAEENSESGTITITLAAG